MTTTTASIPTQAHPIEAAAQEHGSRIITALEGAWAAIRAAHPEVPRVVMITGTGRSGMSMKWGHFGADFWTVHDEKGKGRAPELFAGGELLSLGGRRTMQTLIHEAAHAVAHVRNVKDTSSSGRYHNQRFATIAEELGLTRPQVKDVIRGWSECTITEATAARYAEAIEALDAARLPYVYDPLAIAVGGGTGPATGGQGDDEEGEGETGEGGQAGGEDDKPQPTKPKTRPTRFLVVCGCIERNEDGTPKLDKDGNEKPGRAIQISRKSWEFGTIDGGDEGGLMCGRCREPFRKAQPDDEDQAAG
ncbi:hypothetical protein ACLQ2E_35465 [Streptomyces lavendulocolor]